MQVETVTYPKIINLRDGIFKITSTGICGFDLHLFNAYIATSQWRRHVRVASGIAACRQISRQS